MPKHFFARPNSAAQYDLNDEFSTDVWESALDVDDVCVDLKQGTSQLEKAYESVQEHRLRFYNPPSFLLIGWYTLLEVSYAWATINDQPVTPLSELFGIPLVVLSVAEHKATPAFGAGSWAKASVA